ncbi:MAG: DUF86 domain-containing protein [Campylobacterales bacterium]|nr:DUF86 domain-containing protein [Campylobacterales bacterium]
MFEQEDLKRLEIIQKKIELIEEIVNDFGKITKALDDEKMGKPSILMHLIAIAEQFNKLKDNNAFEILSQFDKQDLKGSYDMRNFIAHDYEGVSISIVELVIKEKLPKMKETVLKVLSQK